MLSLWERVLLLLLVLLLGCWGELPSQPPVSRHRGMNYVAWNPEQFALLPFPDELDLLKTLGVQDVAVPVTWYQAHAQATEIAPDLQRSLPDGDLIRILRRLRAAGWRISLRPLVDLKGGHWRGEIAFSRESDWKRWFESYQRFLVHYAQIAAREGVALFSVGTELERTVTREQQWREVIARVREVFPGALTYSANWDGYERVPFWNALDYVGIDAYFELNVPSEPTVEALVRAWRPWEERLDGFAARLQKPILFTEAGLRSVAGASQRPWDWQRSAPISLQEQANYYEALFRVFWSKPWLGGIYIWAWIPGLGGPKDSTYTPTGKPAAQVLARWYRRGD
ncbi:MAG: hypothetical protein RMJ96_07265 [Candidatus Bipolaricaulota bacterium]|nr:hypothetical protein [Candidatus Bipolaricaulota bacterium]MDW8111382.1 hypothetical protein [Candidatus Bipolaricaulota bacterium]MDW8329373.1 hypothetical protein [Candidatus Bipolaricaulota bacterium]